MSSSDASAEGGAPGSVVESPVLLHVWVVDPDQVADYHGGTR
jgi:hypothetical protein